MLTEINFYLLINSILNTFLLLLDTEKYMQNFLCLFFCDLHTQGLILVEPEMKTLLTFGMKIRSLKLKVTNLITHKANRLLSFKLQIITISRGDF